MKNTTKARAAKSGRIGMRKRNKTAGTKVNRRNRAADPPATSGGKAPEYDVADGKMVWVTPDKNGQPRDVVVAHFVAKIVRVVIVDDGLDTTRFFDIDIDVGGRTYPVRNLPAAEFATLDWVIPYTMGRGRVVCNMTPRARDAIQFLSGDPPVVYHFGHLGWLRVGKEWVYLHAGGAIGEHGAVPDVTVTVGPKFAGFQLPDPTAAAVKDVAAAVVASLRLLKVAPTRVMAPLLCGVWRALFGQADFSLHLVGPTGAGKTVTASLTQQHWGAGLDHQHCPASWNSTANANEALRFVAKDTLLLVDDLAPGTASPRDIDRAFRGQGNSSGRDRMNADSSLRATKYPRGLQVSTGEDTPLVHSAAARTLVLALPPDGVKWSQVTMCQVDASAGAYALALAAFVRWLAGQHDEVQGARQKRAVELRAELLSKNAAAHKRTPGICAELLSAAEVFLTFAVEAKAINTTRAAKLRTRIAAGLDEAASAQRDVQRDADPVSRFGSMLVGAITSGRAHIASTAGRMPQSNYGAWGWHVSTAPSGDRIGYVENQDLYLDPHATYRVLAAMARDIGESLPTQRTLWSRLHERGLLVSTDLETDRRTLTVRRSLDGSRRQVLHLRTSIVLGEPDEQSVEADVED